MALDDEELVLHHRGPRKMLHDAAKIAANCHLQCSGNNVQPQGANSAEQNCNQKHRLGTLLRPATEGRATLQDSSSPQRRKCEKFVQSLSKNMYLPKIQKRSTPQATPKHRTRAERYEGKGEVSSFSCANSASKST